MSLLLALGLLVYSWHKLNSPTGLSSSGRRWWWWCEVDSVGECWGFAKFSWTSTQHPGGRPPLTASPQNDDDDDDDNYDDDNEDKGDDDEEEDDDREDDGDEDDDDGHWIILHKRGKVAAKIFMRRQLEAGQVTVIYEKSL